MMENTLIIALLFFGLLFLGVWATAEYNTLAVNRQRQKDAAQIALLEQEIIKINSYVAMEKSKVNELQPFRMESSRLQKEVKKLEDKHNLLMEEHSIFLETLKNMRRKCQRQEFNGSHLSRIIVADIDQLMDVEKEIKAKKVEVIDKDTEQMFTRIQDKLANKK